MMAAIAQINLQPNMLISNFILFSLFISSILSCKQNRVLSTLECLSDKKLSHIRKVFEHMEYGDGSISIDKLKELSMTIGRETTDQEAIIALRRIDLDQNGKVEFIEFKKEMERLEAHGNYHWTEFLKMDSNHDSSLTIDEWMEHQKKHGRDASAKAALSWIHQVDQNGDTVISCPEFLEYHKG